ncbi:MAG: glycosyltransferase [Microgenomates group bacterium]
MNPHSKGIFKQVKIALVYDWLNAPYGGAEQIISLLHAALPSAPIFSTIHNSQDTPWTSGMDIRTTWLQSLPFAQKNHILYSPLMPMAIESLDLSDYDIIISISSAVAKGVLTKPNQLHICYLLTPTRYLHFVDPSTNDSLTLPKIPILSKLFMGFKKYAHRWDMLSARRPDVVIPISKLVSERASKVYKISPKSPLYPPSMASRITDKIRFSEELVLCISRLVPYKNISMVIDACCSLDKTLVVAGSGRSFSVLVKHAGERAIVRKSQESLQEFYERAIATEKRILFANSCSVKERNALLNSATTVVTPALEDYGISSIDAVLSGCKLITHNKSGSSEILKNIQGVILLDKPSSNSIATALIQLANMPKPTATKVLRDRTDSSLFLKEFETIVYDAWQEHNKV